MAANQRTPLGELDLICRTLSEIVIVEVKARSGTEYGEALEAVGPKKARRLRAAAVWWLSERGLYPCPVRFDVVVVRLDGEGVPRSLHHFRNVLEP
jgi:putative endonuclease